MGREGRIRDGRQKEEFSSVSHKNYTTEVMSVLLGTRDTEME